ncbi:hypothetical protein SSX86_031622 [Deinandra increscens subsp. villosa]|uniref:Protein FAR1-RELATED SEQUENCE n=1 Tax=Deinandra increscens subsp. villosa TaxID=3103831 RepID=A0AAP0GH95_9ASTR
MGLVRLRYLIANVRSFSKLNSSRKFESDVPKGHLAVYVGQIQKRRFVVPISFLDQPLFQDLLRHSEEELGFDHPMGGLTISCHEDAFVELTARLPYGARSSVFAAYDGTKYWKPDVDPSYIPVLGSVYDSWEHVTNMYDAYAAKAGFSTRLGTHRKINDVTRHRYILCNRAGKPKLQSFNSMNPEPVSASKTSRSSLTDCGACIRSKFDPETQKYTLYTFVEAHNHELIGPEFMDFSSKRRMLDFSTQQFIHQLSLNKIGASVAHNVQCSLKGGHHNVRGTKTEFKNFARAIRIFIGDRDAKLVLDTLEERTKNLHNFFYESLIVGNELKSLFWADDVSRCNYEVFGEVLAFDATYKTNQYCMIFVPFTGVDHHKKCVTFGAGLISDETIESYTWLLQCFLKAHVTQPRLVLTDQDGSMKSAIEAVFYQSSHRLCMWHIMRKLPSKIEDDAVDNAALRKSIHKLVWNLIIKPCDFEEKWQLLMAEYGLAGHDWLTTMYNMRGDWIPAYFRDLPMCCLMKTTSICESSNAFFKVNSSGGNTLLQFLMCFDTAIDAQRNNQRKLEFDTNTTVPEIHTRLPIERHAASLYTITIFKEVQKEIERSLYQCSGGLTRTVVRRATEIAAAAAAAAAAASAVASADPFDTHVHQAVDSANQPCVDDGAPVVPPNAPPVRRQPTRAAKRSSGRAAGSPAT